MNPNLTLFIIIIVIVVIIIVIQIIYFHCLCLLLLYHLNHNMDTVILVMDIFLAEALSLSWSTFILIKKIKRSSSLSHLRLLFHIQYSIFKPHNNNRYRESCMDR